MLLPPPRSCTDARQAAHLHQGHWSLGAPLHSCPSKWGAVSQLQSHLQGPLRPAPMCMGAGAARFLGGDAQGWMPPFCSCWVSTGLFVLLVIPMGTPNGRVGKPAVAGWAVGPQQVAGVQGRLPTTQAGVQRKEESSAPGLFQPPFLPTAKAGEGVAGTQPREPPLPSPPRTPHH